ncbi:MAG: glycoside hydrolase family 3 protein [Lachnospiraceae bacterium]|nr:glycoside hydrolase family 3 protein [Lachnospiraceae bacterium]
MDTSGERKLKKRRQLLLLSAAVLLAVLAAAGIGVMIRRDQPAGQTQEQEVATASTSAAAAEQENTATSVSAAAAAEQESELQGELISAGETGLHEEPVSAEQEPAADEPDAAVGGAEPFDIEDYVDNDVERYLASMSLEDRVTQLFFVTPEAFTGVEKVTAAGEKTRSAFEAYPVGGIIYLDPNLVSEEQTREMLQNTQRYAVDRCGFPVFLGLDEEGGRVVRISGDRGFSAPRVRSAKLLAVDGEEAVADAGDTIGTYLSDLGFNLDLAPCADVLTNPVNQVIGDRSFGSDPQEVAALSWSYSEGLKAHGILSCYKHFPGHGGTAEDTHEGYAYSYKTLEEMYEAELIPFIDGSERGIEMIMASHISLPNITGSDLPASLSEQLITDVLRDEIGYQGIVITDALGMGAVSEHYRPGESAVLALRAGCDMLLMASDFPESRQAVLDAVMNGELTEDRINESVRRILRVKLKMQY